MSTTAFVMPNDLSDLCRVCLQLPEESQYLDLTTIYDEDDNLTYGECFTICTQIDLSVGEGVPHHLCKSCGLELQMSYDFHKKIEESKRVIEQCQKQIEEQKRNSLLLQANRNDTQNQRTNARDKREVVQLLNEKYVISDDDGDNDDDELAGTSQEMEDVSIMQTEFETQDQEEVETDEMDIINKICHIEDSTGQEIPPDKDNTISLEHMDEHEAEDADEMDDYQNLEALEDEDKRSRVETYIKIKTEPSNEDQQTKIKEEELIVPTETHFLANKSNVEIKKEISNENSDNHYDDPLAENHNKSSHVVKENSTDDVIKIENETLCEYIITSPPNITPELTPPLRTHHLLYERTQQIGPPFVCEYCGHIMSTKNALYKHRLRKHNQKGFTQQVISLPIKCHLCSKVFKNVSSLRKHTESGHSSKTYVCEHCGYNLPSRNALYQHRLRKHRNKQKLQKKVLKLKCPHCAELFNTAESLRLHKAKHHTKKRNAAVETNELLNTAESLSLHKAKQHAKKRKDAMHEWLECEYCGYKLPTRNAFYQHRLRKHKRHKSNTKTSFRCTYCEIVLSSDESLQSHLLESHEVLPALKQLVDKL